MWLVMNNLSLTESYLYKGQYFTERKEFFDRADMNCYFPYFASYAKFDFDHYVSMYDAIKNYIASARAESKTIHLL